MAFEFTDPTAATLTSITPRTEKHGDDDVFAVSFGLKITGANTLLDKLSPTLRQALYKPVDEDTEPLPGIDQATPLLRATGIELLTLKGALNGWTIEIDHGIDEADPIKLGDCKVDNFRVHPMQGGSVDLLFRVGSNDIDATEAGLLCSHLKQEISFRLTAPKVAGAGTTEATGAAIDGTKGHPGAQQERDATDLFAAGEDHEGEPEQLDGEGPDGDGDDDLGDDEGAAPDVTADGQQPADAERGENWPFPAGGSDKSDMQRSAERLAAEREQEELEAGITSSLATAGVKPKRGARGKAATVGAVE
jgi:hypothetical protein